MCTSLWFAGNAVLPDLIEAFELPRTIVSWFTSSVQFGFISGTLVFALFAFADKYSPSRVFFVSALLASGFNALSCLPQNTLVLLLAERFLTGFFLAGIYPIGMKIASDYFDKGLGKSLGFLVGALVLGTSFPHLLKATNTTNFSWKSVILGTSLLAIIGGVLILVFVPDGPYRNKGSKFSFSAIQDVFRDKNFRKASFGYFGHMWELYAFWAFVPVMLKTFFEIHQLQIGINHSFWSFLIIAIGSISCVISGYIAHKVGEKITATYILTLSGICCLVVPVIFYQSSPLVFMLFLIAWGFLVIADSPLFSTMVAKSAPSEMKGSALTLVNCIGFSITILSIQLIGFLFSLTASSWVFAILSLGPLLGVAQLSKNKSVNKMV